MFGYIRINKDELKVKEYNLFKAYYCGLCKTLKRRYGLAARMGLSYDLTFLLLIMSSLNDEIPKVSCEKCIANPFKKKSVICSDKYTEYAADANLILTYFKLRDDFKDNHSLKSALCLPLFLFPMKKARKNVPRLFSAVKTNMEHLSELEKSKCADPDILADSFAKITQSVFSSDLIKDEKDKRIMSQMGYLLGRFIYLLDVCDDFDEDKKSGAFNVLSEPECVITREELLSSLEFTLSEVSSAYALLNLKKNKPILDNIIYSGLLKSLLDIIKKSEKGDTTNERPV